MMNKLALLVLLSFFISSCGTRVSKEPIVEPVYNTRKNPEIPNSAGVINFGKYRISDKAASVLNQLFTSDISNDNLVLIIKNESDCDFIMDIVGKEKIYKLPVSAKKEETIVIGKGDYQFTTEICNSTYSSKRHLVDNTQIVLKHSFVTVEKEGDSYFY